MNNSIPKTRLLQKPLARFKRPTKGNQSAVDCLSHLAFVLPNGQMNFAKLDNMIVLGRGSDTLDGATKINLGNIDGVSRHHVFIQLIDDMVMVRDYNSLNGTFLNKAELFPMRNYTLKDGDKLMLGKVEVQIKFMYQDEEE